MNQSSWVEPQKSLWGEEVKRNGNLNGQWGPLPRCVMGSSQFTLTDWVTFSSKYLLSRLPWVSVAMAIWIVTGWWGPQGVSHCMPLSSPSQVLSYFYFVLFCCYQVGSSDYGFLEIISLVYIFCVKHLLFLLQTLVQPLISFDEESISRRWRSTGKMDAFLCSANIKWVPHTSQAPCKGLRI